MPNPPRRNRVDPWGDLHAVAERGLLTGNRGCLVDDDLRLVRHHTSSLWISCQTSFRGWRQPLEAAHRWTPLFFLDDAVALAAGHRPCATCRTAEYRAYRRAVTDARRHPTPLRAAELDRLLVAERHQRGRGLARAADRLRWTARPDELPDGTVIVVDAVPALVLTGAAREFSFAGWGPARPLPDAPAEVLTPPTSVAALRNGFAPLLHPSARE